ncbi:pyridoxamine 5'-phosphate oxidase family protein [Parahaliea mediterranea]|uniref:Pyridoxamine 5'-phosphate oxidase family protein n=1 Tax=Parahaliea mediterranea TaxID=651086 RepID=A0A939DE94_9GAMM|nr:pyridoxamine 5'-phosphate oxidase family protein [Parahaliea mediterranea]MBN7795897.1 pyridoxamine 5'-phosphate oxidase family protein [Parahaliea mediterranea]
MTTIASVEELEAVYGEPAEPSIVKEINYLSAEYRALIEASPMMILATSGPNGLDCTPRGDKRGFVRVVDERTLVFPDRRGNNRIDSLRNIVRDHRVATLFLIPGYGTMLRVNGTATVSTDGDLLASFAVEGKLPRTAVIVKVESAFFHCARAIVRSGLWDPGNFIDPDELPTPGQMLAALSDGRQGGREYDAQWPERARKTLW